MSERNRFRVGALLTFFGSTVSFYIGAGFATMQEIVQYEASYGSRFPLVILTAAVIFIYTNLSFATNANRLRLARGADIYDAYCGVAGPRFGPFAARFYRGFSAFFCYASFIVMCGGAGSTVSEQWGLPVWLGSVLLALLSVLTAVFGLRGITAALGRIGPVNVGMMLLVAVGALIRGAPEYAPHLAEVDTGVYAGVMKQIGGGSPFLSGASYGGFVILWFVTFIAELGAKNRLGEVNGGMLLGSLFVFTASALCCAALICFIPETASAGVPALVLAEKVSPVLAAAFAVTICCGTYAASVPLLWTAARALADESSPKYRPLTVLLGAAGCLIACFLPYRAAINLLYGLNGYLGFVLVAFMLVYDIRTRMSRRP